MLQIESPLVSVDWLHQNLEADNLVLLDATIPKVGGNGKLNSEYIPKSVFFDITKNFSDVEAQFPNTLPSLKQFETEAQKLGINTISAIVVYDQHGIYSSARAWWLFKYFGHTNVAVLDGGLPQWILKGFQTTDSYFEKNNKGDFKALLNSNLFTDFDGVKYYSESKNTQIIDARSSKRFTGEIPEPRNGLRSGTIPNSINLPFTDLLSRHKLKSKEELNLIFKSLFNPEDNLIFSCGSGITACNLALAVTVSGYKNLKVYDGSWTEYGTLTQNTMEAPDWTKDELIAYTLLYAAHSDFKEDNHERNVIISKVDMQTFQKVHDEFSEDNDYQSIQKILASIDAHKYSIESLDRLLADIKGLFFADGDFDIREHSMLLFLKRILK